MLIYISEHRGQTIKELTMKNRIQDQSRISRQVNMPWQKVCNNQYIMKKNILSTIGILLLTQQCLGFDQLDKVSTQIDRVPTKRFELKNDRYQHDLQRMNDSSTRLQNQQFRFLNKTNVRDLLKQGGSDGGGGMILVLNNEDGTKSYQVVDYYQSIRDFHFQNKKIEGEHFTEILENILRKMDKYSPVRAQLYREWLSEVFRNNVEFKYIEEIPNPNDLGKGSFYLPMNLDKIVMGAYQRGQEEQTYMINNQLLVVNMHYFDKLDELNKAYLLMHELVYFEARMFYSHTTSKYVRYLNALIMSNQIETREQFRKAIKNMNKSIEDWNLSIGKNEKRITDLSFEVDEDYSGNLACLHRPLQGSICLTNEIMEDYVCEKDKYKFTISNFSKYILNANIYWHDKSEHFKHHPSETPNTINDHIIYTRFTKFDMSDVKLSINNKPVKIDGENLYLELFDAGISEKGACTGDFLLKGKKDESISVDFQNLKISGATGFKSPLSAFDKEFRDDLVKIEFPNGASQNAEMVYLGDAYLISTTYNFMTGYKDHYYQNNSSWKKVKSGKSRYEKRLELYNLPRTFDL